MKVDVEEAMSAASEVAGSDDEEVEEGVKVIGTRHGRVRKVGSVVPKKKTIGGRKKKGKGKGDDDASGSNFDGAFLFLPFFI